MLISFILIFFMTFMGALAAAFLKRASSADSLLKLVMNWNFYAGGTIYVLAAILNIIVLHYMDYSVVVPLTSITYIWTMVVSKLLLHEAITKKKIFGIFFIILGVTLISLTKI